MNSVLYPLRVMNLLTRLWVRMARCLEAIAPYAVILPLPDDEPQGAQVAMPEQRLQTSPHLMRGADAWVLPQKTSDC